MNQIIKSVNYTYKQNNNIQLNQENRAMLSSIIIYPYKHNMENVKYKNIHFYIKNDFG